MAEINPELIEKMFQSWGDSLRTVFEESGLAKVSFHTAAGTQSDRNEVHEFVPRAPGAMDCGTCGQHKNTAGAHAVRGPKPEPADDVHEFKQAMPGGTFCGVCGRSRDDTGGYHVVAEEPVTIDGLTAEIRHLRAELEAANGDRPWWHQMRHQFIEQAERLSANPVPADSSPQRVLAILAAVKTTQAMRGELNGARDSLRDRDTRIAQMRSNLQARDAKVTALEMDLRRKDEENADQKQHIEQLLTAANTSDDTIVQLGEDNARLAQKLAAAEEVIAKKNTALGERHSELQILRQQTAPVLSDTILRLQQIVTQQITTFGTGNGLAKAADQYRRLRGLYTVEHDAEHGVNTFDSAVEALSTGFALKWPWDRASFDRILKAGDRYVHAAALSMCAEDVRQFVNKRIGDSK